MTIVFVFTRSSWNEFIKLDLKNYAMDWNVFFGYDLT